VKTSVRAPGKHFANYRLRPGDVIEVKFERYPDFNQTVVVQAEGTISLRGACELTVINLSSDSVEELISEEYRQFLAEPVIEVTVPPHVKSFFRLFAFLQTRFDLLLVHSPSYDDCVDTFILSKFLRPVVLLIFRGAIDPAEKVNAIRRELAVLEVPVLGVVDRR